MAAIRIHLDESVDHAIARGLRDRGIDATTATDAGLLEAADTEHIAFALAENRAVFTHDEDFLRLHAAGVDHAGIAYCHQDKHSLGENIQMLLLLHECYTAEEMHGHLEFL